MSRWQRPTLGSVSLSMHERPAVYKHIQGHLHILNLRNTGEKETHDTADKQNSMQTLTLPSAAPLEQFRLLHSFFVVIKLTSIMGLANN